MDNIDACEFFMQLKATATNGLSNGDFNLGIFDAIFLLLNSNETELSEHAPSLNSLQEIIAVVCPHVKSTLPLSFA
jgi:hypothetical protein